MSLTKSWEKVLHKSLEDPSNVLHYLNISLKDEDPDIFLIALKNVLKAQLGEITELAEKTSLSRESLYRTLSLNGNPRFSTLLAILDALGFQLAIEPKKRKRKASKKAARGKKKKIVSKKIKTRKTRKITSRN